MEKLIRDHVIPPLERARMKSIARAGLTASSIRVATADEMPRLLGRKLVEEANEVLQVLMFHPSVLSPDNRIEQLLPELADVFEVVDAIAEINDLGPSRVSEACDKKFQSKGGFQDRLVLTGLKDNTPDSKLRQLVEDVIRELIAVNGGTSAFPTGTLKELVKRADELGCIGTVS